jgi:hypothetical protein
MIVFEEKIGEILDLLPSITDANGGSFKPFFNWGTQDVLNKYLALPKTQEVYPLIWLVTGVDEGKTNNTSIIRDTRLILAMHSDKQDYFNPEIYKTDFKVVLNPLLENVIKALEKSGISEIQDLKYKIERMPNYSVSTQGEKTKTVDVWNAILFDCKIRIKEGAINQMIF